MVGGVGSGGIGISIGGGSGGGSGYVRERILKIDPVNDKDFVRYLTSSSLSVADIVSIAQAVEPGVTAAALKAEFMVCGSGGAGASGTGTGTGDDAIVWGGLPAHPIFHTVNVGDLDATVPISIEVGAVTSGSVGGSFLYGNSSTISITLASGQTYHITSYGGDGGTTSTSMYKLSVHYARSAGLTADDPTIVAPLMQRVNSTPVGPGIGAPFSVTTPMTSERGGNANHSLPHIMTESFYMFDGDHHFRAFGIGGLASYEFFDPEFDTRDGGSPGGGGGAGDSAVGHAGGSGGAGEVRLQLSVMETV